MIEKSARFFNWVYSYLEMCLPAFAFGLLVRLSIEISRLLRFGEARVDIYTVIMVLLAFLGAWFPLGVPYSSWRPNRLSFAVEMLGLAIITISFGIYLRMVWLMFFGTVSLFPIADVALVFLITPLALGCTRMASNKLLHLGALKDAANNRGYLPRNMATSQLEPAKALSKDYG